MSKIYMKLISNCNKVKYVMLDVCTIQSALTKHECLILLNNSHGYFKGTVEDISFRILKYALCMYVECLHFHRRLSQRLPKKYIYNTQDNIKISILCSFFQTELTDILSNLRGL